MNVVVFGSAEGVGRLLVAGARGRGHAVTAFETGRTTLDDLLDPVALAAAVAGQGAVIYAVAPPGRREQATRASQGMRGVVRAMRDAGVRRLVCLSIGGLGSEPDGDPAGLVGRLLRSSPPKGALADLRHMEVTVRQSGLEWTIVRPARMVDGEGKHSWRAGPGYAVPHGTKIARADVAEFMLDQLDDRADVGHAVAIAW
jgi:uncharacterized protein YbjT (DUF2867 family)